LSYANLKRLTLIALPVALLIATHAALPKLLVLPAAQRQLVFFAPYLAFPGALLLSLAFNRGRVFFPLSMLAVFYLVFRNFLLQGTEEFVPHTLYLCSSLIIPLNLALFCFVRERGIFTHSARLRFGFLCAQGLTVFWIIRYRGDYSAIPELLGRPMIDSSYLSGFAIPQSGLLLFLLAGIAMTVRALKRRYPIDLALLGTLAALAITLNRIEAQFVPELFITAAIVLLTIGLLQDSHRMAFCDDLTGLPSRRALNEQVMMGLGRRYVVAMLDVDHFKRFNDTHGHDVGDQALKMVGAKIARVKGGGRPFRYGGEEFTILFPRKDLKDVIPYLEEVRQAIGNYQLCIRGADRCPEAKEGKAKRSGRTSGCGDGEAVSVTVSIGVAASEGDACTPADVIKAADKALYRAKQKGRDQIAK
jgi:GGDEF domain-containing protein